MHGAAQSGGAQPHQPELQLRDRPKPLFRQGFQIGDDELLFRRIGDPHMAHLGARHHRLVVGHPGRDRFRRPGDAGLLQRLGIGIARICARLPARYADERRPVGFQRRIVGMADPAAVLEDDAARLRRSPAPRPATGCCRAQGDSARARRNAVRRMVFSSGRAIDRLPCARLLWPKSRAPAETTIVVETPRDTGVYGRLRRDFTVN